MCFYSKRLKRALIGCCSVHESLASVTLTLYETWKTKGNSSSLCASTFTYSIEEVQEFYEDIQSITNRRLAHYNVIMGEFNAELGKKVAVDRVG